MRATAELAVFTVGRPPAVGFTPRAAWRGRLVAAPVSSTACCRALSCRRISGSFEMAANWIFCSRSAIAGNAEHVGAGRHVGAHAGLGAQHGSLADAHVIAHADLAGHHHVVAGGRAAGHADLRADHVVLADAAVVGDHHQVVDLGAVADDRRAVGAAIDGRAGADLAIAADLHVAQLRGRQMAALEKAIAKTVAAQHGAGMHDRARRRRPCFRTARRWDRSSRARRACSRP